MIVTEEEINKVFNGFKKLNKGLIKGTNCNLFIGVMIKLVIFNALALIFWEICGKIFKCKQNR